VFKIAAKKVYFFGLRYKCPVCNARTRSRRTFSFAFPVLTELDVIGGEHIANDNCPVCFSGSRERLLHAYLRQSGLAKAKRVLNVAPERGIYESLFKSHPGYVAIDTDPGRYDYIRKIEHGDLTRLKYAGGSFDLVICSHVLEHVPDDATAMREIARVLSPGGKAILQVPFAMKLERTIEDPSLTDERERERRFGQFDHIRIYGPDYFDRLRAAGLQVEAIDAADAIAPMNVKDIEANPRERIFLVSRA
jgi:SAM-dependent methyltransferase